MSEVKEYPNVIGGAASCEGAPVTVENPYDGSPVGKVYLATPDEAGRAAHLAAESFAKVKALPAHERKKILLRLWDILSVKSLYLAELLCRENGKPIALTKAEVARMLDTLELSAEESGRIGGEFMNFNSAKGGEGRYGMTMRVPLGPVLAITPFNFPLNLLAHKAAPAIAIGAPVVHKPCMQAPLTSFEFASAVYESGWPAESYSAIYAAPDAAEPLVRDDKLKVLSFTGSDAVGWKLKSIAGKKKVLLELGGSASCIIEPDAPDLDYAISRCVAGSFAYSGQVCISIQRLILHESIYDKFVAEFIERTKRLKTGDPMDEATDIGPVIDNAAADRIESWIDKAVAAGARILTGERTGERMFNPFVLEDVPDGTELGCSEVFGPVVALYRSRSLEEAIEITNRSRFGLQSGLFTSDISKAMKAFKSLEVGGLMINEVPGWRTDAMPYGGSKDSGEGREGPRYAIEDMTEIRLMVVKE